MEFFLAQATPSPNPVAFYSCIAAVTTLVSILIAVQLFSVLRKPYKEFLDGSKTIRGLAYLLSGIILPLLIGAWSDIIDLSELLNGTITTNHGIALCFLGPICIGYLLSYILLWDRDEQEGILRVKETAQFKELNCQKDFLARFLGYMNTCIGIYQRKLDRFMSQPEDRFLQSLNDLKPTGMTRSLITAAQQAYQSISTVPNDTTVTVILFQLDNGYYRPVESYDGTSFGVFNVEYETIREEYSIERSGTNIVAAAGSSGSIFIVDDAEAKHADRSHPFYFSSASIPRQRENIGSGVAIPIEPNDDERFVLWLSCPSKFAFLEEHRWKAKMVQQSLKSRLNLLREQERLVNLTCKKIAQIQTTSDDSLEQNRFREKQIPSDKQREIPPQTTATSSISCEIPLLENKGAGFESKNTAQILATGIDQPVPEEYYRQWDESHPTHTEEKAQKSEPDLDNSEKNVKIPKGATEKTGSLPPSVSSKRSRTKRGRKE